jgi:hypothetical protein
MKTKVIVCLISLIASVAFGSLSVAADWQVVGAGNANCEHWGRGTPELKKEILSWMAGFASAMNLDRAAEGRPEYRLKLLTYDYLRIEIDAACSISKNNGKSMSSILFEILQKFPTESKK